LLLKSNQIDCGKNRTATIEIEEEDEDMEYGGDSQS
jgi:hypothetical protein